MEELFDIARINRETLIVENIERASQSWIDENSNDEQYMFVKTPDEYGTYARVGFSYDDEYGLFGNPYFLFPPLPPLEPDFDEQLAQYEANK